ncbi:MAG: ABC transporter permease, partial [Gammaproteobacteria bacterium]
MVIGLLSLAHALSPDLFPSLPSVLKQTYSEALSTETWLALGHTGMRVGLAFGSAVLLGVGIGLLIGDGRAWQLSQPTVDFFRSIPVTFLIPLVAMAWSPLSEGVVWLLTMYPSALIMILGVYQGFQSLDRERMQAFVVLCGKWSRYRQFVNVTRYELLPQLFTSARLALSYSIVIATVLEYMNIGDQESRRGIGALIQQEFSVFNAGRVVALVLIVGIVGQALNKVI